MQDERVAALLDDGDLRSGMFDAIGAKHAAGPGARMGIQGLGDRHRGLRGGGNAEGIGGTDTRGVAGGDRRCGRGGADVGAKRHASAIRHCDQRERNKDPGLAGKVVMQFTISGDGSVSGVDVKGGLLGSDATEACIKRRFHTTRFPEPKGNGVVVVSHPVLFTAGWSRGCRAGATSDA